MNNIDVHILTMPGDNPQWAAELRADLDAEPVNQHWLPGIPNEMGQARAAGYRLGNAEYVAWACPDDRIIPGTFAALQEALERQPFAPFAWTGEQRVNAQLQPVGQPHIWPDGYNPTTHRNSAVHVHGVVLMRRLLVAPALPLLERAGGTAGFGADWLLTLYLARPGRQAPPDWQPVHLPIIGRLWRLHAANAHRQFTPGDFERIRRLAGTTAQYLHGSPQRPPAARHTTPATTPGPGGCASCGLPRPA